MRLRDWFTSFERICRGHRGDLHDIFFSNLAQKQTKGQTDVNYTVCRNNKYHTSIWISKTHYACFVVRTRNAYSKHKYDITTKTKAKFGILRAARTRWINNCVSELLYAQCCGRWNNGRKCNYKNIYFQGLLFSCGHWTPSSGKSNRQCLLRRWCPKRFFDIFKCIFVNEKFCILIKIQLKFCF